MLQDIESPTLKEAFEEAFNAIDTAEPERYEVAIAVWPCGEWCYAEEAYLQTHKSDDYAIIRPSIVDEEDIEEAVLQYNHS